MNQHTNGECTRLPETRPTLYSSVSSRQPAPPAHPLYIPAKACWPGDGEPARPVGVRKNVWLGQRPSVAESRRSTPAGRRWRACGIRRHSPPHSSPISPAGRAVAADLARHLDAPSPGSAPMAGRCCRVAASSTGSPPQRRSGSAHYRVYRRLLRLPVARRNRPVDREDEHDLRVRRRRRGRDRDRHRACAPASGEHTMMCIRTAADLASLCTAALSHRGVRAGDGAVVAELLSRRTSGATTRTVSIGCRASAKGCTTGPSARWRSCASFAMPARPSWWTGIRA